MSAIETVTLKNIVASYPCPDYGYDTQYSKNTRTGHAGIKELVNGQAQQKPPKQTIKIKTWVLKIKKRSLQFRQRLYP
jgi:hypothetical protein